MKRLLAILISASMLFGTFVTVSAYVDTSDATKVKLNEGFSGWDANTSIIGTGNFDWTKTNAVTSFNAVLDGTNTVAEFVTNSGDTGFIVRKFATSTTTITGEVGISFDYKVDSTKNKGVQLNIQPNSGHGICLDLGINIISSHNGTATETLFSSLTKDEWYHVDIKAYTSTSKFDITITDSKNTSQTVEGKSSRGTLADGLAKIQLASKNGTALVLLDNFLVGPYTAQALGGTDPEPDPDPTPSYPETEVEFVENFEADAVGQASSKWTKNSAITSDDIGYVKGALGAYGSGVGSEISLTSGATTSVVTYNLPTNTAKELYGNVYATFDFMIHPDSVYGVMMVLFDTNNKHGVCLTVTPDGSIIADQREVNPNQTLRTIAANIKKGQWYNIAFDIDTHSKTYDAYIDGVLAMDNVGFRSKESANIKKLIVSASDQYGNGVRKYYIDNLKIKNRDGGFLIGTPKLYSGNNELESVQSGNVINAAVTVKDYDAEKRKALSLILAQYDDDGILSGVAVGQETKDEQNSIVTIKTPDYTVKQSDDIKLKAFLWNNSTLIPVTFPNVRDSYEYQDSYSVFTISDSITADYTPNYLPQVGLGMLYKDIFDDNVTIKNYAKPSRSTKSFIDEGRFDLVMREIKKGDLLFIQMGHNDKGLNVSINEYKQNLEKFIDGAKVRGAYPVLITPPSPLTNSLTSNLGDYPDAMIDVGNLKNVPVIDLHKKSLELYNKTGNLATDYQYAKDTFFLYDIDPDIAASHPNGHIRDNGGDGTHLRDTGAEIMINFIAEEIVRLNLPFAKDIIVE